MALDAHLPFSQHKMLSPRECAEARDHVFALRNKWTRRPEGKYFTLGTVSAYDAPGNHARYMKAAKATNPFLQKSFGWLHERLRLFFEEFFGETVVFDPRYALPGFHIFAADSVVIRSRYNVARGAHFDCQWMDVIPGKIPKQALTFTLPVELPLGGSSLQVWRVRYPQTIGREFSALDYASTHPSRTVKYHRGRIVVHDGLSLHGVGHGSVAKPKGYRITMQGHGVRFSKGWTLYW